MKIYRKEPSNYYNMRGTSMLPTLRAGEGILIDPDINQNDLCIGDIIVYTDPKCSSRNIIHRIVEICSNGYFTCGDNNWGKDDYIVKPETILGKVLSVRRVDKTLPLADGAKGYSLHRRLKFKKFCLRNLTKIPSFISGVIESSRILNIFHSLIKVDVIKIKTKDSYKEILVYNKRKIGEKKFDPDKWIIRFPYKYFINKKKL